MVIVAAGVKVKAGAIWAKAKRPVVGPGKALVDAIERLKCWDMIEADPEIAYAIGGDDRAAGVR